MQNICLVCGYNHLLEPPYNKSGRGSDEICPCCGFQFGLDDDGFESFDAAYHKWRTNWVQKGCQWYSKYTLPDADWHPILLTLEPDLGAIDYTAEQISAAKPDDSSPIMRFTKELENDVDESEFLIED